MKASGETSKIWVVSNDEQGRHTVGVKPDGPGSNRDDIRKLTLWGNLMAGGAGVEYYFGYEFPHTDLNSEDWRQRRDCCNQDGDGYSCHCICSRLPS